ncbi:CDP-glucose 4,6-dehydratase [Mucilaginibacter daejeonensis]|uniref:CDP-glucose 4,6-dehydratase n=1 Tax=Mucilaginibacter daejeonensis TaxID=398049 RepID=UPI001D17C121|nr:CDP-glucose 4,6-dehydratase [Mucilaginibacter daejeonensis]UEG54943.1 CDP-glucose 4,6-dehydratase [Mucilaginibacter daejeonensis]
MENLVNNKTMFENIYKGKKVLVTGHTGFKGSWLCLWLKMLGADVFGISNEIYKAPNLYEAADIDSQIVSHIADIRDLNKMTSLIKNIQPDFIFHLAAQPIVKLAYEEPVDTFTTNIIGTANILEALRVLNYPCIAIMITSDKCYDNVEWVWGYRETDQLGGKDPYSASKGGAELIIKTYFHSYFKKNSSVKIASVRAGNVIGGGDWAANRIVPDCFRAWASNEKVVIRSPNATRPWQHVLEPLSGYLRTGQLLHQEKIDNGEAYNFGPPTDKNYTVIDLIKALANDWDADNKDILNVEDSNFLESGLLKLNIDKALFDMQWIPTLDFDQTAIFTSEWYKNYYQKLTDQDSLQFTTIQIEQYVRVAQSKDISWALR